MEVCRVGQLHGRVVRLHPLELVGRDIVEGLAVGLETLDRAAVPSQDVAAGVDRPGPGPGRTVGVAGLREAPGRGREAVLPEAGQDLGHPQHVLVLEDDLLVGEDQLIVLLLELGQAVDGVEEVGRVEDGNRPEELGMGHAGGQGHDYGKERNSGLHCFHCLHLFSPSFTAGTVRSPDR